MGPLFTLICDMNVKGMGIGYQCRSSNVTQWASLGESCALEGRLPLCLRQGQTTLRLLTKCARQVISLEIQQRLRGNIKNEFMEIHQVY